LPATICTSGNDQSPAALQATNCTFCPLESALIAHWAIIAV
jgi:hypothetical protein